MNGEQLRNNGAYRISRSIGRRPAVNVHHAQCYAELLGLPLRTSVTINFSLTGVPADTAVHLFRIILAQRFAPWLRRTCLNARHVCPTYVWVAEAGGGHLAVHWLLHVPPRLMLLFREKLTAWIAAAVKGELNPRVINIKPVTNVIGLRRYMLKGVVSSWAAHLGVDPVPQGIVVGKRSGFSRNLGPSARSRGGYKPRLVPPRRLAA
jgi:hypothetical protein